MKPRAQAAGAVLVALAVGGVGTLASCNVIVGVGDYAVGDATADGTTAPGDDSGGSDDGRVGADAVNMQMDVVRMTTDAAADMRAPGLPDAGGDRRAADAGSGEAAPICGQSPPTGQAAFQNIVSACVLTISCDPFFYNVNISGCITYDFLHSSGAVACLSTIQDCTGFFNCTGTRYATVSECPAGSTGLACDSTGSLTIDCANQAVHDCKKSGTGTLCQTYVDSTGSGQVGCAVVPSCVPNDGGSECTPDMSTLFSCAPNGVGYGSNCTAINATCLAPSGGTDCYYNATACTAPGVDTCTGGTLTQCTLDNKAFQYNCPAAGLDCVKDDAGVGYCQAPGCPLSTSCVESCHADGHTMTVCVGGLPYDIDCATQPGFRSCLSATQTSSGVVYAYCQ